MQDQLSVLVVDDEPSVRDFIKAALRHVGFKVIEAGDGIEALGIIAAGTPVNLVLTDVVMPGMGGLELLVGLHRARPGLPAIVVSGKVDTESDPFRNLTDIIGVKRVLAKPFSVAQLVSAVRQAVGFPTVPVRLAARRGA